MTQRGSYLWLRRQIKDGDLIAIRGRTGLLPRLTRWVTGSPYMHTAIAVWIGSRLVVAEMKGDGNHLVPLSQYASKDFDVYAPPNLSSSDGRALIVHWLEQSLEGHIGYDWLDLVRLALWHCLRVPMPPEDFWRLVCSGYSYLIYLRAGWQQPYADPVSPAMLVARLGTPPVLEVRHV